MNILCPNKAICIEDANSLGNYSSEDPDRELFRSTYFPNQIWDGDNDVFTACYGLCISTISQADADLCAQNLAKICEANKLFGNEAYTCYRTCPDGQQYSFTIPYGTFWADSQAQADALAQNWCNNYLTELCQSLDPDNPGPTPTRILPKAQKPDCNDETSIEAICVDGKKGAVVPACRVWAANKDAANIRARTQATEWLNYGIGCLTPLLKSACVDEEISQFVVPDKVGGFFGRVSWEVFGIPPPGINFQPQTTAMRVYGTFTKAGTYGFRLTMTDWNGTYTYRVYFISVMEITSPEVLPSGEVTVPYSTTIQTLGGWDPKTFTKTLASGNLPPGLAIDASTGTISGIPTSTGTYNFRIRVTDNEGGTCEKDFQIFIDDNLFAAWVWNNSVSEVGCGVAYASGAGAYSVNGASLPGTASPCGNSVGRSQSGVFMIDNTGGPAINCELRVSVQKTNLVPPATNGIQCGSETIYMRRVLPSSLVIANTFSAAVPAGEYTFPFTIPAGVVSTYELTVLAQAAYAGPVGGPYVGGSSDFQITLARI
jgi:hypothetical protein